MKWPLVWRADFDAAQRGYAQALRDVDSALERERVVAAQFRAEQAANDTAVARFAESETRVVLAERLLLEATQRIGAIEQRYHDLVTRSLAPVPAPAARIEMAPPDVDERVRHELSRATQERLARHILETAQREGLPVTEAEAREHAEWMANYAEQADPNPL